MKKIILFLCFLLSVESWACGCRWFPPIEEWLLSDYVFKGKIKQIIPLENDENKVIFEILTIYKGKERLENHQEIVTFAHFGEEMSSCAWRASEGEIWMVFSKGVDNKKIFSAVCSYTSPNANQEVMEVLENIHLFNPDDFYFQDRYFLSQEEQPPMETSAFEKFEKENYLMVFIFVNTEGKAEKVISFETHLEKDPIFNLIRKDTPFPKGKLSKIEKKFFKAIKKHKHAIKTFKKTGQKANYFYKKSLYYNKNEGKWVVN